MADLGQAMKTAEEESTKEEEEQKALDEDYKKELKAYKEMLARWASENAKYQASADPNSIDVAKIEEELREDKENGKLSGAFQSPLTILTRG